MFIGGRIVQEPYRQTLSESVRTGSALPTILADPYLSITVYYRPLRLYSGLFIPRGAQLLARDPLILQFVP